MFLVKSGGSLDRGSLDRGSWIRMLMAEVKGGGKDARGQLSHPGVLVSLPSTCCLCWLLARTTFCLWETGEFVGVYKLNRHFIKFR